MDKYKERGRISQNSQILKYGGVEEYRAEMRRRRSLVKNVSAPFKDKELAKIASQKGLEKRWGKKGENSKQKGQGEQVRENSSGSV